MPFAPSLAGLISPVDLVPLGGFRMVGGLSLLHSRIGSWVHQELPVAGDEERLLSDGPLQESGLVPIAFEEESPVYEGTGWLVDQDFICLDLSLLFDYE